MRSVRSPPLCLCLSLSFIVQKSVVGGCYGWLPRRLRAGLVWVNSYLYGDVTTPFGGFKQSGYGRRGLSHSHPLSLFTPNET